MPCNQSYKYSFYSKHFMYHETFEFLRWSWLRPPEDGTNSIEIFCSTDTVMICVTLTCLLLNNEVTFVPIFYQKRKPII